MTTRIDSRNSLRVVAFALAAFQSCAFAQTAKPFTSTVPPSAAVAASAPRSMESATPAAASTRQPQAGTPPGPAASAASAPAVRSAKGKVSSVTSGVAATRTVMPIEIGPRIVLYVGDVQVVNRPGVVRIAVGNGSLVNATAVDDRQIVLIGDAPGETMLHTWLKDGRQIAQVVVVRAGHPDRVVEELASTLRQMPGIQVRMVGERVLIEGRYPDAEAATRVKMLAATFPQVVNLVPERPVETAMVFAERMIHLDLRVVEVRKRALDQLGIKWASTANGPTFATSALGYANSPWRGLPTEGFPPTNTFKPVVSYLGLATQITSALQFLEQTGDSWTLAEPRLSCRSGGQSKFVAGGEIPIPVQTGVGQVSVVYKQYGVVIEFKPVANEAGQIESAIVVEVSEPDPRNSNQGFIAFTTNRTETQFSLKENEPLVISGLLRQQGSKSLDGIPGLAKLPVLGSLFSSREFRNEQTELLVVVTPRIVNAASASNQQALEKSQQQSEAIDALVKRRLAD